MQASTVRLLEAANFSQPQAFALAEAIDAQIHSIELLTVSEFKTSIGGLEGRMDGFGGRMDNFGERIDGLDGRLGQLDKRLDGLDGRLNELKADVNLKISEAENRLFTKTAALGLSATGIIIGAVFFMMMNLKR